MAVGQGYSSIATNGLIFAYDIADTRNSYLGRPTTNILANTPIYIYNNVPGSVSATLTATSETYRGATVYKETLTALDGSGASWLSGCNNPGIGVYTGGGGGNANQYSGHTIYFKPTTPMCSCPCYTNYSNIGGWQSSCNIEDMGDGWYRAYVLWYNTVTQGDGKYWAINPLSTSVGQTVTVYWAGPFREDLNSTTISQFVNGTRSNTGALLDLSGKYTLTPNNNPYTSPAINPQLNFDGTDDSIDINSNNIIAGTQDFTIESTYNHLGSAGGLIFGNYGPGYTSGNVWFSGQYGIYINGSCYAPGYPISGKNHMVATRQSGVVRLYLNGNLVNTATLNSSIPANINYRIGTDVNGTAEPFTGQIYNVKVYNRALSAGEVLQNYNHYKTRYNLP